MPDRSLVYFVSDVHLGLDVNDPVARERRFVAFLESIPKDKTRALYMLGDIWDFWYEYRDLVPKGYVKVFAALMGLMDAGVEVFFFQGNHDIWCYHYFEDMGIRILQQPYLIEIGGKSFCLGHGDGLGPGDYSYKLMRWLFRNKLCQRLFSSLLHPTLAFKIGKGWSKGSRLARNEEYHFKGEEEPLYKFALKYSRNTKVDYFIFGHFHTKVDMTLPTGARLLVLKDWVNNQSSNFIVFDLMSGCLGISQNIE
ncbi:MAG: UDP-2,3-diacylglucosamine diphosphatase [Bacteroidales bacterium]|nr:UDP-2,3-diacylglucosamine diphosphatase [Bacteroidales bacterium]